MPPTVEFPEAANVVKAPVEVELAPIAVPSIAPPFISTVVRVDVPEALKVVKAPVDAPPEPIAVLLIASPEINVVSSQLSIIPIFVMAISKHSPITVPLVIEVLLLLPTAAPLCAIVSASP